MCPPPTFESTRGLEIRTGDGFQLSGRTNGKSEKERADDRKLHVYFLIK